MPGTSNIVAIAAAAGLAPAASAAVFIADVGHRLAQTAYVPVGDPISYTGPVDLGFGSWFGNSTVNRPGAFAFASHGSSLTDTTISVVGETFVATTGPGSVVASRSSLSWRFDLDGDAVATIFAQGGGNFGSGTTVRVTLFRAGGPDIIDASGPFTDFREVALTAGTYYLTADVFTRIDNSAGSANGYYNISISIPAPGAVAVLAAALPLGSRRRRAAGPGTA